MSLDAYAYFGIFIKIPTKNILVAHPCCGEILKTKHCPECGAKAYQGLPDIIENSKVLSLLSSMSEDVLVFSLVEYTSKVYTDNRIVWKEHKAPTLKTMPEAAQYLLDKGGYLHENTLLVDLS